MHSPYSILVLLPIFNQLLNFEIPNYIELVNTYYILHGLYSMDFIYANDNLLKALQRIGCFA